MPVITIIRTPEWATVDTLPPKAVINLPAVLADPLLLAGEAVRTPGAVITHTSPFGGAGVPGGGSGGSGDSITEAANSGGLLSTLTINGVQWTYVYSGTTPIQRTAFGGSVVVDITENGDGYYTESGNIFVHGGAIKMNWATAAVLGDAIVAGTYVVGTHLENGLRIYATDVGGGTELEWSDAIDWWRGVGGAPILLSSLVAEASWHTGATTESAAKVTVSIPAKLLAINGGQCLAWASMEVDNGGGSASAGTLTPRWKFGGTAPAASATSTGQRKTHAAMVVALDGARNTQTTLNGGFPYNSASASTPGALTSDTASAVDVTLTYTLSVGTDRVRYRAARVWVQN